MRIHAIVATEVCFINPEDAYLVLYQDYKIFCRLVQRKVPGVRRILLSPEEVCGRILPEKPPPTGKLVFTRKWNGYTAEVRVYPSQNEGYIFLESTLLEENGGMVQ